jgi:riboflavin biosynthesis pyrimidine reductase
MAPEADPKPPPRPDHQLRLRRVLPPGDPVTAAEFVEELGLWDRPRAPLPRPQVLINMVSTVDGRATVGGRSGPLSDRADRELFHALRSAVDGVLVGAGTVRMERYGRLIGSQSRRRLRRERGLEEEPLACIVSGRLALEADIPLLAEPEARVAIVTPSAASLPAAGAQVEYLRAERDGHLELPAALAELRARFGVQLLLCEGGPHLSLQLIAAGLADELFLSVSPQLAGGEAASGEALRILAGAELDPPLPVALLGALECESHLFLRYRVSDEASPARAAEPSDGASAALAAEASDEDSA